MTIEVAEAFRAYFSGLTFGSQNRSVKFSYGDQKELNSWLIERNNKRNPDKYPLIWGVLDKGSVNNGTFEGNITFIVMNVTQVDKFNDWRYANSYTQILLPVCQLIEQKLVSIPSAIQVLWNGNIQNRFMYTDEPNYGVEVNDTNSQSSDFRSKTKKGEEAITIDVVDARILQFKTRININCLK